MGINSREKTTLAAAWKKAKPSVAGKLTQVEWPDGEYEFKVTTWEPDFEKARIKAGYTIIGGNDAYIGQEHLQYENLVGSEAAMGYFKGRLVNMGIPESDFEDMEPAEVLGEELTALVLGKTFVGQARNKNDFLNVYANRPIEGDASDSSNGVAEKAEDESSVDSELSEGNAVSFVSKVDGAQTGTIESIEDGMARVKADNGKIYKLPLDRLTVSETEQAETEEVQEEETNEANEENEEKPKNANGHGKVPAQKAILAMRPPELKQLYAKLKLKFETTKQPREFLAGVAGFVHDKKYMPAISMLPALAIGLGLKTNKGDKPADVVKQLRQKALSKFS